MPLMENNADQATEVSREPGGKTPANTEDLAMGHVLNRRFVIEAVLGRGGMGVVYRALDLRKQESGDAEPHVALKVLSGRFRHDPRMATALQRESRKAQSLAHPNVTTVYDFDRDDNLVYITMEEMTGQPLDELIADHPQGLPRERAAPIILGAARGLAYAHSKGVVHADFKPSNVFLTKSGDTRILDFGIARAAPAAWLNDAEITREPGEATRFVTGELSALTPGYAALEMFAGLEAHPADDVYALAIVSYKLLTGQHPYQGLPAPEARKRNLAPKRPPGLRRHQWRILRRGLAFQREQALGYIGWEIADARLRQAPDVPFDALSKETRRAVEHLMGDAVVARRAGEQEQALLIYEQAYQLHPRNRWITDELEEVFDTMVATHLADPQATAEERAALLQRLQGVIDSDQFLGSREELLELRERLLE